MCARMTAFDHLYVSGHYGMSKEPRDCYALHQSCRQPIDEIITKKQNLTNGLGRILNFNFGNSLRFKNRRCLSLTEVALSPFCVC